MRNMSTIKYGTNSIIGLEGLESEWEIKLEQFTRSIEADNHYQALAALKTKYEKFDGTAMSKTDPDTWEEQVEAAWKSHYIRQMLDQTLLNPLQTARSRIREAQRKDETFEFRINQLPVAEVSEAFTTAVNKLGDNYIEQMSAIQTDAQAYVDYINNGRKLLRLKDLLNPFTGEREQRISEEQRAELIVALYTKVEDLPKLQGYEVPRRNAFEPLHSEEDQARHDAASLALLAATKNLDGYLADLAAGKYEGLTLEVAMTEELLKARREKLNDVNRVVIVARPKNRDKK